MSWRRFNVAERGPPDPILVRYPGSDATASPVTYIVCMHGQVTAEYKLWSLNAQGVREVHLFAWVRLSTSLGKIHLGLPSTIREGAVFHLLDGDRWTAVSSFFAATTLLRIVLQTSFLLKISSFIPGAIILLWSGLLAPITLVERTSPLLVRKGSIKGVIMSVCALSGSNVKESLSSVTSPYFVRTWAMT